MPSYSEFALKTSKSRVMSKMKPKLTDWEKSEQRATFTVVIEKRNIDGKVVKVMRLERPGYFQGADEKRRELPKEYTSISDFSECVKKEVETLAGLI